MPSTIQKVAVVGAGAMGRQIALNTAIHGLPTSLYDISAEQLQHARDWMEKYLADRVAKGRMTAEQTAAAAARMRFEPNLADAVTGVDLVIEATIENLDVKRQIFAQLDRLAPEGAILATNSSTIVSSKLADATRRPDRVANLHYFNPALVMQVVEVVQGPHTDPEVAASLVEFARQTGKQPIWMKKEIFGFVANRLLHALRKEALFLLENGYATHEEIDLAAEKASGTRWAPSV